MGAESVKYWFICVFHYSLSISFYVGKRMVNLDFIKIYYDFAFIFIY